MVDPDALEHGAVEDLIGAHRHQLDVNRSRTFAGRHGLLTSPAARRTRFYFLVQRLKLDRHVSLTGPDGTRRYPFMAENPLL